MQGALSIRHVMPHPMKVYGPVSVPSELPSTYASASVILATENAMCENASGSRSLSSNVKQSFADIERRLDVERDITGRRLDEERDKNERRLDQERESFRLLLDDERRAFLSKILDERAAWLKITNRLIDELHEARRWHIFSCMHWQPHVSLAPPYYSVDQQPPPPRDPPPRVPSPALDRLQPPPPRDPPPALDRLQPPPPSDPPPPRGFQPVVSNPGQAKAGKWAFTKTLANGLRLRYLNTKWKPLCVWRWHLSCVNYNCTCSNRSDRWFRSYSELALYLKTISPE